MSRLHGSGYERPFGVGRNLSLVLAPSFFERGGIEDGASVNDIRRWHLYRKLITLGD